MFNPSPLEQFEIHPILGFNLGWIDLSFTNSALSLFIATVTFYLFADFSLKNKKIVPNSSQSIIELIYEFVHGIVQEQIGSKGYKYFPFIFTIFLFIACSNLLGMIPYNFTATSHVLITFGLSFSIFIGVTIIGFQIHGFHFLHILVPSGVPFILLFLIIPIEFLSYFMRALSLGIRLAANMFAGHTLLKIISTFAYQMLIAGGILSIAALGPIALLFAFSD